MIKIMNGPIFPGSALQVPRVTIVQAGWCRRWNRGNHRVAHVPQEHRGEAPPSTPPCSPRNPAGPRGPAGAWGRLCEQTGGRGRGGGSCWSEAWATSPETTVAALPGGLRAGGIHILHQGEPSSAVTSYLGDWPRESPQTEEGPVSLNRGHSALRQSPPHLRG